MGKIVEFVDITKLKKGTRIVVMPDVPFCLYVFDVLNPREGEVSVTCCDFNLKPDNTNITNIFHIRWKEITTERPLVNERPANRHCTASYDVKLIEILPNKNSPSKISRVYCKVMEAAEWKTESVTETVIEKCIKVPKPNKATKELCKITA